MNIDEITLETLESDPYPIYAALRRENPIVSLPGLGGEWLVTTWDGCSRIGAMSGGEILSGGHPFEVEFFGGQNILTMEGDAHSQLRAGIDVVLRPRHVHQFMDDDAHDVVRAYVERIASQGAADLVSELFEPISVRVVGNRLGMRDKDDDTLRNWFRTLSGGLAHHDIEDDAAAESASQTMRDIDDYLKLMVDRLRHEPDDSLISHMLHSGLDEGAPPRTYDDVIPSIRVIILGGFQEPGAAIANTFLGLLTNPDQFTALAQEPEKYAATALMEGMRWISPIGTVERTALRDIEFDGIIIPKDSLITLVMASANRDETYFPNADKYDLFREIQSSAVFGYGNHYCAGNFLAKSLGTAVITEVASRLKNLRLTPGENPVVTGHLFRGVETLRAEWDV